MFGVVLAEFSRNCLFVTHFTDRFWPTAEVLQDEYRGAASPHIAAGRKI
jgi:hypothetical protein